MNLMEIKACRMGQRLTIYDFSKIMNESEDLNVWDISHSKFDNAEEINKIDFKWEWQGYSGFGEIYLKNGIIDCGDQRCRDSCLTISSESEKQASKHYSTLYNEKALLSLFEYIIYQFV